MRESERWSGGGRVRRKEFSVFVQNLPHSLDQFGLRGVFQRAGAITDTYIPYQHGSKKDRYGFVRFYKIEDARRSIQRFHESRIRGRKIYVSMAKPKKQFQQGRRHRKHSQNRDIMARKVWRKVERKVKTSTEGNRSQEQANQKFKATIVGQRNEDVEMWLERSLVCTTEEPRDLATLESAIMEGFGQSFKLRALSSFKFLLTLPTQEALHEALDNHHELDQWFADVKKWGMEECCDTRKVWLEVVGVPPHGWCWEIFKQIAELWGRFICLGKSTSVTDSFEVMKILVATKSFQRIEEEVLLTVGYGGYRVMVKETVTISQTYIQVNQSPKNLNDYDRLSNNDISGFEDMDDNINNPEVEAEEVQRLAIQHGVQQAMEGHSLLVIALRVLNFKLIQMEWPMKSHQGVMIVSRKDLQKREPKRYPLAKMVILRNFSRWSNI